MRVLICGSRDWTRSAIVETFLEGLKNQYGDDLVVIEGGARGADKAAGDWAKKNLPPENHLQFPADWDKHKRAAGAIRNTQMLKEGKPDFVVAFKDDFDFFLQRGGTENMVQQAHNADVPCYVVRKYTYKKSDNWREEE